MEIDRRGFILAMLSAAAIPLASGTFRRLTATTASAAPLLRPSPRTAEGEVCSRCGNAGHAGLHPACPANTQPWAAVQAAARAGVGRPRGSAAEGDT